MKNIKSNTDSNKKYLKITSILLWVVFIFFLIISISVSLFLSSELQRERLLRKYSLVAASKNIPNQPGVWNTTLLLKSNETIACVMDSYGQVEHLPTLNSDQIKSLPKSELPSEGGYWYLLAFSERQIERIALYPIIVDDRVFIVDGSCGDRASQFLITPRIIGADRSELAISFNFK